MNLGWEMHYVSPDQQLNIDLHRSLVPQFFGLPDNFIDPTAEKLTARRLVDIVGTSIWQRLLSLESLLKPAR